MSLTTSPVIVHCGTTHYVFVEKVGPFNETAPKSWQELHALVPEIAVKNKIGKYFAEYKVDSQAVYRAGVSVAEPPADLPLGLRYEALPGGKYSRFTYVGPYSGLSRVSGEVWSHVREKEIAVRDDFSLENYESDPETTPDSELVTEILIPTM
jgi:predicted transcriptional regulator YdeE